MNAQIHRKSYGSIGFTSKIFIHTFPSSAASLECERDVSGIQTYDLPNIHNEPALKASYTSISGQLLLSLVWYNY